ncbi:MAG TPA: hypothetical protein VFR02_06565 [bacterium]|nr:hypothetical protein [bacterium]
MDGERLRAVAPFAALSLWWALGPVARVLEPGWFFPAWSAAAVWGTGAAGALGFGWLAWRNQARLAGRRRKAASLLRALAARRRPAADPGENDVILAGRVVSRLVRNADEDLREIGPDFSPASLDRLRRYLPQLLDEVGTEEEGWIRLGVVGTYLGETLCRGGRWRWFFRPDPTLRQFSYTPSLLRRDDGRELDPYGWAAELFGGGKGLEEFWKEAR